MKKLPFYYNEDLVTGKATLYFYTPNGVVGVDSDHPSYGQIKKSLATLTEDKLRELLDVEQALKSFVESSDCAGRGAEVVNGVVLYDGKPVHNAISKRVLEFMRQGLPFKHLLRFLENMKQNPSATSQAEGFDFLDHRMLPITDDGCFLAWKAVSNNWMDKYSGTIRNKPGDIPSVARGDVDDRREHECSFGLHVGAMDYVGSYGHGDDRLVVVKVNPRDIVSVPLDHNATKLRCCKYEVLFEYVGEKLNTPLCSSEGKPVNANDDDGGFDWAAACYSDGDDCDDDYDTGIKDDGYNSNGCCGSKCSYHNKRGPDGRFVKK